METSTYKKVANLWELPDCGKISNPYFVQLGNNSNDIPVIDLDDTDSVKTLSTTDVSEDDSLKTNQSKVNSVKKKRLTKKLEIKEEPINGENGKDQNDASNVSNKTVDKSEIIPGLESIKLTTTIEEINEPPPSPPKETINIKPTQCASQLSTDNLVQPMKTDNLPTTANEIVKQSTETVTNGTQPPDDDEQQLTEKPKCRRIGCADPPVENPEWDYEYCSSKCAVKHCKIAFTNWVIARQLEFANSAPTTPSSTMTAATN